MSLRRVRPMIAAGLIERSDNHLLIALPDAPVSASRRWQFPRGRAKAGEMAEKAMRRIAREDLGLDVEIVIGQPPFLVEINGEEVEIRFFICGAEEADAERGPYQEIRWIQRGHLYEYEFDEISQPIVDWFLDTDGGR